MGGNGCQRGVLILVNSQLFHYYFWMVWLGGGEGMGMNKGTFFPLFYCELSVSQSMCVESVYTSKSWLFPSSEKQNIY